MGEVKGVEEAEAEVVGEDVAVVGVVHIVQFVIFYCNRT